MELTKLKHALHDSWSSETSYKGLATVKNPARGQCVVSSLVVQDYFGGDLRRVAVRGERINETHYFNILDDRTMVDVTGVQYDDWSVNLQPTPIDLHGKYRTIREKLLDDHDTFQRYNLLKSRVANIISNL